MHLPFVLALSDTVAMRSASGSHSSEENLFFPVSAHVALVCLLWMYPQCDGVGFLIIFMGVISITFIYLSISFYPHCANVPLMYQAFMRNHIYLYLINVTLVCFGCTHPQCHHFLYFQEYAYVLMFQQFKQCKQQCKQNVRILFCEQ